MLTEHPECERFVLLLNLNTDGTPEHCVCGGEVGLA